MSKSARLATILLLAGSPAHAQSANAPDSLLNHLIGHWVLRGEIAGHRTIHDVTFVWVLGNEYVQMHEVARDRTAAGSPTYEAIVYLGCDPRTHEYAVLWLDNTAYGAFDPAGTGRARASADSIPFVFQQSGPDRFHTTFVYDRRTDTWQWHMDNERSGTRQPFARVTLARR